MKVKAGINTTPLLSLDVIIYAHAYLTKPYKQYEVWGL